MEHIIVTVNLFLIFTTKALCMQPCNLDSTVDISNGNFLENGDVFHQGIRYQKKDYYYDNSTGVLRGCVCLKRNCMRKCCPLGQVYYKRNCSDSGDVFAPPIWTKYSILTNINVSKEFHVIYKRQLCESSRVRLSGVASNYHLRLDGRLYIEIPTSIPPWTIRTADSYCLDTFVTEDANGVKTSKLDALVCFNDETNEDHYVLSSTCMLISCFFILATVAVYFWLPELRNLHGKVLVSYLLSLFVGFLFLATMQIMLTLDNISNAHCLVFSFFIYFFLLSAFFWLNVMSFDIWWTFSGKRGLSLEKLSSQGRFHVYSMYAFGVPTALTILLISLEFSGLPPHPLLPLLQHQGCFLYGISKLIYLYGPILILCLLNTTFFFLTMLRISKINKETAVLKSKESATHDQHRNDKQRFILCLKLFLIMGINWLLEVFSAIYPEPRNFWRYTDAYNVLIGLTIFIIFVCKKKIFRLMKKR